MALEWAFNTSSDNTIYRMNLLTYLMPWTTEITSGTAVRAIPGITIPEQMLMEMV